MGNPLNPWKLPRLSPAAPTTRSTPALTRLSMKSTLSEFWGTAFTRLSRLKRVPLTVSQPEAGFAGPTSCADTVFPPAKMSRQASKLKYRLATFIGPPTHAVTYQNCIFLLVTTKSRVRQNFHHRNPPRGMGCQHGLSLGFRAEATFSRRARCLRVSQSCPCQLGPKQNPVVVRISNSVAERSFPSPVSTH